MKLVLDEKLKHRLIGLAVVISLAAIFAPAVMRKSSQRLEHNFSANVQLPPKPTAPNVVVTEEKDVFKTIKVARVDIPTVSHESHLPELAKAQSIKAERSAVASQITSIEPQLKPLQLALEDSNSKSTPIPKTVTVPVKHVVAHSVGLKHKEITKTQKTNKSATTKDVYSVQLASFSRLSNAQSLVNRLKAKGYKANLIKIASRSGVVYKVSAGQLPHKEEALRLKTQLASAMQLNGFVVNTGVS
jgi:DedD protein